VGSCDFRRDPRQKIILERRPERRSMKVTYTNLTKRVQRQLTSFAADLVISATTKQVSAAALPGAASSKPGSSRSGKPHLPATFASPETPLILDPPLRRHLLGDLRSGKGSVDLSHSSVLAAIGEPHTYASRRVASRRVQSSPVDSHHIITYHCSFSPGRAETTRRDAALEPAGTSGPS
jgi:hypothetical protein